ncbi:MAG TPA: cbb3-type cytochrome oxidase assembly protein CcoS [Methylomirabilota bacterium]|nr:cbb3-type cytochrome oxidase assembly protein CcoS [Methylomirabilota bacterium]
MNVLLILIPLSVLLAGGFLAAFIWAVCNGQYEDTTTPSLRVLFDDKTASTPANRAGGPGAGGSVNSNQS